MTTLPLHLVKTTEEEEEGEVVMVDMATEEGTVVTVEGAMAVGVAVGTEVGVAEEEEEAAINQKEEMAGEYIYDVM